MIVDADAVVAKGCMQDFNPQNLANIVWVFASAGHALKVIFDTIAEAARDRMMAFSCQELVNTVWAFAEANHA